MSMINTGKWKASDVKQPYRLHMIICDTEWYHVTFNEMFQRRWRVTSLTGCDVNGEVFYTDRF
jgi:hypothetical protein